MIGKSLKEHLDGTAGLSALVGTRTYPVRAPQKTAKPYLTFHRVDSMRTHTMGGPRGMAHPVYEITSWAETYAELDQVADETRKALDGYCLADGQMGSSTLTTVHAVFIEPEEEEGYEEDVRLYWRRQRFKISHEEATS